jgi:hypothetical protein
MQHARRPDTTRAKAKTKQAEADDDAQSVGKETLTSDLAPARASAQRRPSGAEALIRSLSAEAAQQARSEGDDEPSHEPEVPEETDEQKAHPPEDKKPDHGPAQHGQAGEGGGHEIPNYEEVKQKLEELDAGDGGDGQQPAGQQPAGQQPAPAQATAEAELEAENKKALADMIAYAGGVGPGTPGGFPRVLGLTTWNWTEWTYPDLQFDTEERHKKGSGTGGSIPLIGDWLDEATGDKEWVAKIKTTTFADGNHNAIALPVGKHYIQDIPFTIKGRSENFGVYMDVDGAYNAKITQAEQEHQDDLTLAYNLSLKPAGEATNALAGREFTGATEVAAKDAAKAELKKGVHARLGADAAQWRSVLRELVNLTKSQRDQAGTHSFSLQPIDPNTGIDAKGKKLYQKLGDGTTRFFPSANIIKL